MLTLPMATRTLGTTVDLEASLDHLPLRVSIVRQVEAYDFLLWSTNCISMHELTIAIRRISVFSIVIEESIRFPKGFCERLNGFDLSCFLQRLIGFDPLGWVNLLCAQATDIQADIEYK